MKKAYISFVVFVCPSAHTQEATGLPLDGFSLNMIFEYFSKICRESLIFIKIPKHFFRASKHHSDYAWNKLKMRAELHVDLHVNCLLSFSLCLKNFGSTPEYEILLKISLAVLSCCVRVYRRVEKAILANIPRQCRPSRR
jgi:hypothetical protein